MSKLGTLSEKYETGGRGAGTVSSGRGDAGGVSYGTYQMTSQPRGGSVATFVARSPYSMELNGLAPGSEGFTAKWKWLALTYPDGFANAQHGYIRSNYYDPFAARIKDATGLDVSTRSFALRQVVWSTAVQHGPRTSVFLRALGDEADRLTDKEIIRRVYEERGRRKDSGALAYFSRNSPEVQTSVAARFHREGQDALAMLEAEWAALETKGVDT